MLVRLARARARGRVCSQLALSDNQRLPDSLSGGWDSSQEETGTLQLRGSVYVAKRLNHGAETLTM